MQRLASSNQDRQDDLPTIETAAATQKQVLISKRCHMLLSTISLPLGELSLTRLLPDGINLFFYLADFILVAATFMVWDLCIELVNFLLILPVRIDIAKKYGIRKSVESIYPRQQQTDGK